MTDFPSDFIFGASSSAYQIEGAVREGGRGESVWDRYCHLPGTIQDGKTGDVACDHYHRFEDDIALMAETGLDAWHFSIAWPRIFPKGSGAINREGVGFYDRLIDTLLERGIKPFVGYYHFDLPQALQHKGGWASRDVAYWYADYVGEMGARIADRVDHHLVMNDPARAAYFSSLTGTRYFDLDLDRDLDRASVHAASMHHLNLGAGLGAQALRSVSPSLRIGAALDAPLIEPARDEEEDFEAAKKARDWMERAWTEPLLKGIYPEAVFTRLAPFIKEGDLGKTCFEPDFLGLNHFTRRRILAADNEYGYSVDTPPDGAHLSHTGDEMRPDDLAKTLLHFSETWPELDLYITANGAALADEPDISNFVDDRGRMEFLAESLYAAQGAMENGARLKGYFAWSLLDSFEWTHGYEARFGLVRVDFGTQARIPKASWKWYRETVRSRRLTF